MAAPPSVSVARRKVRGDVHGAKARFVGEGRRMTDYLIHVLETGNLTGNLTFLRGDGWSALLRRPRDFRFPVYSFVLEAPDGLTVIDTGMGAGARSPRPRMQRRFVPAPHPECEIGPAMAAAGLDPAEVRRVVLTHLDWDHAGGLRHFPDAEVLVHRPEYEFAKTFLGRQRYEPQLWPSRFNPGVYDLDDEPYGPFPQSKALDEEGALRLVPLGGHSPGQVGVIARVGDVRVVFTADHILRQDWFFEDCAAGRWLGLGVFFPRLARATSRRLLEFVQSVPTVLVPSHDAEARGRIDALRVAEPKNVGKSPIQAAAPVADSWRR